MIHIVIAVQIFIVCKLSEAILIWNRGHDIRIRYKRTGRDVIKTKVIMRKSFHTFLNEGGFDNTHTYPVQNIGKSFLETFIPRKT